MNAGRLFLILAGLALILTICSREPSAVGAAAPDRVAVLEDRIEALEKTIRSLDRSRDVNDLKSRVSELERLMRNSRQGGASSASRTSGFSQVQRENASLKSAVRTLESKVSTGAQVATQLRREIDNLRLKVSTLQTKVDRLR